MKRKCQTCQTTSGILILIQDTEAPSFYICLQCLGANMPMTREAILKELEEGELDGMIGVGNVNTPDVLGMIDGVS